MAETKFSRINKVIIVGTVEEVDVNERTTADGRKYVNGKVVVKSTIQDKENLFDIKVLAFEKTSTGSVSTLYTNYIGLPSLVGKRIRVQGDLREGSFVTPDGQLRQFNEIYGRFFNLVKVDEPDCATFEYSGFVVKSIYKRTNKDEEILGYRLDVAQANYSGTNIQVIRFDIDKNDMNIVQAIESAYEVGQTVKFYGTISHISRIETREEQVSFGEPVVKQFVTTEKVYRITSGDEPFTTEDPTYYTDEAITSLVAEYKKTNAAKIEDAKKAATPSESANEISKMTRTSGLTASLL